MEEEKTYPRALSAAAVVFIVYITVYILMAAAHLLIPLVFAILLWYLINTMDHGLSHVGIRGWHPPRWLRILSALAALALFFNMAAGIIVASVSRVVQAAPQYQANLEKMLADLPFGLELDDMPVLHLLARDVDIGLLIQRVAREFAGFLGNIGLVLLYMIFLFLEQHCFGKKINAAAGRDERRQWIHGLLSRIDRDVRRYIGVKTMLSLITALGAWAIMRLVGLDYAGFWALLIFLFNFIPTLGSIAATIMPSLLALLQFDTYPPFFVILFGVGALQLVIGNMLDPLLMGKSLNVSPLVIIFSLVLWGVIWGLPGMFLCVPITVIVMIILSNFKQTRWIAMLLSKDGRLEG